MLFIDVTTPSYLPVCAFRTDARAPFCPNSFTSLMVVCLISCALQTAVPKYAKVTLSPASGSALTPGGPAITQLIRVDNSAQGTKPSEWWHYLQPIDWFHIEVVRSLIACAFPPHTLPCLSFPFPAVALKLKLVYTLPGAPEPTTEVTDVRNFPPTL